MKQILSQDIQIYYGGDMANDSGFGKIIKINSSEKWGINYDIRMDDDRIFYGLSPNVFSEKYLGHGGTKFVTKEAYLNWRKEQLNKISFK